jgi:hypothetical protein
MKEGFNDNISNEEYHGDREYISSSGLKLLLKNPSEFVKVYINGEKVDNSNQSAMDFGSYVHALILEPHLVEAEFAVFEGLIRRGKDWDDFSENNKDKKIVTSNQRDEALRFLKTFHEKEVELLGEKLPLSHFFTEGEAESTLCGTLDDVKIKTRFDYIKEGIISDIKTTSSLIGSKKDVAKICEMFDYDLSAALYVDLAKKYTGKDHDFYFCFFSKANGDLSLWRASKGMIERGRAKYKRAIELLKRGRETGFYINNEIEEID